VLIAADDHVIRQLIAANLILEGFDVATAVDGRDCLEKALAISPDIVVLDVSMPRVDGLQTAVQLRKSPDASRIKVVLIIAREDLGPPGTRAGVDAYVTKPFDPADLIRVVRELTGPPRSPSADAPAGGV
jgi:DNA-binding response OmpR family regulator